ncbi:MAG: hypothetical protein ABWX90_04140, partial [Candidatus Saccharimonadales bacterium]
MTLVFIDGFNDLESYGFSSATVLSTTNARYGTSVGWTGSGNARWDIPVDQQSDTLTLGIAVYGATGFLTNSIFDLRSDFAVTQHTTLMVNGDGSFNLRRGGVTNIGTTVAGTFTPDIWHYVEMQVKLHDTTGFAIVKLDGTTIINVTGVDTKNAGTKTVYDQVRIAGSPGWLYDDLYIKVGAGETFLGPITVETIYPNGNGNVSGWMGSDSNYIDNYLLVDEPGVPVTTDYVRGVALSKDQYTLSDLVHTDGNIVGICHVAHMALPVAGAQKFRLVNRRLVDTPSPALSCVSIVYIGFHHVLTGDPDIVVTDGVTSGALLSEPFNDFTSAPWTVNGACTIVAGRTGTAAQTTGSSGVHADYTIPSISESDVVTFGCAFRWTDAVSIDRDIVRFMCEDGTAVGLTLRVLTTGALDFCRVTATSLATSAAGLLVANTWYYIEMQAKVHDTAGYGIVKVNGSTVINVAGIDTLGGTIVNTAIDQIRIGAHISGPVNQYDDLYLKVGAGASFATDWTIPNVNALQTGVEYILDCTEVLQEPFNNITSWTNLGGSAPTIVSGRNGNAVQINSATQLGIRYT